MVACYREGLYPKFDKIHFFINMVNMPRYFRNWFRKWVGQLKLSGFQSLLNYLFRPKPWLWGVYIRELYYWKLIDKQNKSDIRNDILEVPDTSVRQRAHWNIYIEQASPNKAIFIRSKLRGHYTLTKKQNKTKQKKNKTKQKNKQKNRNNKTTKQNKTKQKQNKTKTKQNKNKNKTKQKKNKQNKTKQNKTKKTPSVNHF